MINQIGTQISSYSIVTIQIKKVVVWMPILDKRFWTHEISDAALAKSLYSTSVDDLETNFWRADFQEVILFLR